MKKIIGVVAVAGLLIGTLATPSLAQATEETQDWQERVVVQRQVGNMVFRVTARYDSAQKGQCLARVPSTIEELGRPCPVHRPFKDADWLTKSSSQDATLEIAIIQLSADGHESGKTAVVVPFAGQLVP